MSIDGLRMNQAGIRDTMRDPRVKAMLLARMQAVAARANANAPVGETGFLSQSHYAYLDERPDDQLPVARVASRAEYALRIEAATGYLSSSLDESGGPE